MAAAYYFDKNLLAALDYLNSITNESKQEMLQDIVKMARLFQLLIHQELGHDILVINSLPAFKIHLKTKGKKPSIPFQIADALHKSLRKKDMAFLKKLWPVLEQQSGWEEHKEWLIRCVGPIKE